MKDRGGGGQSPVLSPDGEWLEGRDLFDLEF